jgi:transposase InsO family protein
MKHGGRQNGRALRYAEGSARGLLHHPLGHDPFRSFGDQPILPNAQVERGHHRVYATRDEARRDLFAYIEGFYNSRRLKSATGCRSPADMERMAA